MKISAPEKWNIFRGVGGDSADGEQHTYRKLSNRGHSCKRLTLLIVRVFTF